MFSAWNYLTSRFWWSSSSSTNVLLANITGEISIQGNNVNWEIKDFFDLPQDERYYISAPCFSLAGKEWVMYLFPSGYKFPDSIPVEFQPTCGWLGMVLLNTTDCEAFDVQFGVTGNGVSITRTARCFKDMFYSCTFLERPEIELFKNDLVPGGVLHVSCEILTLDERLISVKPCTQVNEIDGTSSPQADIANNTAVSGTSSTNDLTPFNLFNLHPDGNISLKDRDTEILAKVLQFRYSGEIPEIPTENTNRLIYIAYKCGVTDLAELMPLDVDSMTSSMTEETVCDVIRLAELKGETVLLERATRFHEEKVLRANEWRIFDKDYMADAKQLRLEALERRRLAKRKAVFPSDFSEMVYGKLVALACHPNNRDEGSGQK